MIHARKDYQERFGTDPAVKDPKLATGGAPIGEDEPVFLLRAKDILAPQNVLDYAARAEDSGLPDVAASAREHAARMTEWQTEHGAKLPDLPPIAPKGKK